MIESHEIVNKMNLTVDCGKKRRREEENKNDDINYRVKIEHLFL